MASKVGSARPGYPVANQYGDLIRSPASVNPVSTTWDSTDAPCGGGGIWVTPSLDAEKGLLYIAVGNPVPDFFGGVRMGNNLYTAAMIVLDARNLAASTSECSSAIVDESPHIADRERTIWSRGFPHPRLRAP